jgi:hypothetical protein
MAIYIRKLTTADEDKVTELWNSKMVTTNTDATTFQVGVNGNVSYKYFLVPKDVYGGEDYHCHGYFNEDKLLGIIGHRSLKNEPAWLLSFIVTHPDCVDSIAIIKKLLNTAVETQENSGHFQWFVISRLDKFKVWQKLFRGVRNDYHHYVYARTPANTIPKWNKLLTLCGSKIFSYDTNVSMYVSKKLCTMDDNDKSIAIDEEMLKNDF